MARTKLRPWQLLPLVSLGLLAPLGCSSDPGTRTQELTEISARHRGDLERFHAARTAIQLHYPVPMRLEFPGQGTVYVHECNLRGFPGQECFWFRYTYLNTTGHDIYIAHVDFRLRDPRSGEERWVASDLRLPLGMMLTPNSSYTTFVEVPLADEEVTPELEWKIDVKLEAQAGSPEMHQGSQQ